ncbi:MAG: DUF4956 domain-containing protein [Oscillospiraceae bacterium]|nr:DUF4956 domain-containing protein [Oscillospiraceae bacterium]
MLNSILTTPITLTGLIITLVGSLILGILTSLVFSFKNRISSSLSMTLAILPVAMSMVVTMINGNLGIAVAVAGGFTLVRFRSIAGTGREISAVFTVMTLGVICGMGYMGIAVIFFLVIAVLVLILTALHFGENRSEKLLRVTIPEDYDYVGLFDDIFKQYGITASVERIKTTNMGTLIDVTYRVSIPGNTLTKEMLDAIRARNANLSITVANYEAEREAL